MGRTLARFSFTYLSLTSKPVSINHCIRLSFRPLLANLQHIGLYLNNAGLYRKFYQIFCLCFCLNCRFFIFHILASTLKTNSMGRTLARFSFTYLSLTSKPVSINHCIRLSFRPLLANLQHIGLYLNNAGNFIRYFVYVVVSNFVFSYFIFWLQH